MGIDVMPETAALRDVIVRNQALPGIAGETLGPDPAAERLAPLPFVGRDAELARLQRIWQRAARGSGALVLVNGEGGIGKSRLIGELALAAEGQGARILTGTTSFPESRPYQALIEAIRGALPLLASVSLEPVWLAVLAPVVPELRSTHALPALEPLDHAQEQQRLFTAFTTVLRALAKARPVLLLIEDLHWAGAATCSALSFAARLLADVPLLAVATAREETAAGDPVRRMRRELQQDGRLQHVALGALKAEAIRELIVRVADARYAEKDAEALGRITAGNPLFLESVLRAGEHETLDLRKGIVDARAAEIGGEAGALAEIAATVGQAFNLDLVREVSAWSESDVLAALAVLMDRRIVRENASRNGFDFVFAHQLLQAAFYERTAATPRKLRHVRIAHVLQRLYPQRSDELAGEIARHLDSAGQSEPAARWYLRAARWALGVHANDVVAERASRGLDLAPPNSELEFELLALREEAAELAGEREAQARDIARLRANARARDDGVGACKALERAVLLHRRLEDRAHEAAALEELERAAAALADSRWRADAKEHRALYDMRLDEHARALDSARGALALFDELGDARGRVNALTVIAYCQERLGKAADAAATLEQAFALADAAVQPQLRRRVLRVAMAISAGRDDNAALAAYARESLALCTAAGDCEGQASALSNLGIAAHNEFDVAAARDYYERSFDLFAQTQTLYGMMQIRVNQAELAINLGDVVRAFELDRAARELARRANDRYILAHCDLNDALAAVAAEDVLAAHAAALRARELYRAIGNVRFYGWSLLVAAIAERLRRDYDQAGADLDEAAECFATASFAGFEADLCDAERARVAVLRRLTFDLHDAAARLAQKLDAFPMHVYLPQIAALLADAFSDVGDLPGAQQWSARGARAVSERCAKIPDEPTRALYRALPFQRRFAVSVAP
jgi:AAA ATPase domain